MKVDKNCIHTLVFYELLAYKFANFSASYEYLLREYIKIYLCNYIRSCDTLEDFTSIRNIVRYLSGIFQLPLSGVS